MTTRNIFVSSALPYANGPLHMGHVVEYVQSDIWALSATSLRGVISQQLLPTKHKPGRVAALEILVNTSAVSNLIRQGKLDQLETAMQAGGQIGMQTMDSALMNLVERKWVSGKEAYQQANNKQKFQKVRDET